MPVPLSDEPSPEHCPRLEYTRFIAQQAINPQYHLRKIRFYRSFLEQWPYLPAWFAAPLAERVGRTRGEDILHRTGTQPDHDLGVDALVDEAVLLGFNRASAHQAMYWSVNRIVLHTGVT